MGENTEVLVGVLVAVAPGTPVDAFAPVLLDAWGGREDILHAGCEDDFACGEGDGFVAGVVSENFEESVVLLWLHGCDGTVDEVHGAIVADLLAGCEAEPGGSHTVKTEDVVSVSCGVIAVFARVNEEDISADSCKATECCETGRTTFCQQSMN